MEDNIEKLQKQNLAIPIAIVIAGALIAAALYFGGTTGPTGPQNNTVPADNQGKQQELSRTDTISRLIETVPLLTTQDHIIGNPDARLQLIEYSDIECPFCRRFHTTIQKIMKKYGADGSLVWAYRHFPLSIHPKAYPEALATECVAHATESPNVNNLTFWNYLNTLMQNTVQVPDTLPAEERIIKSAEVIKLDSKKIISCVNSATYKRILDESQKEALAAGLGQNDTGTPYTVLIAQEKSGTKRYFIDGAQPFESVESIIKTALEQLR